MPSFSTLRPTSRGSHTSTACGSNGEARDCGDYYMVSTPEIPGLDEERAQIAENIEDYLELTTEEYVKGLYNDLARRNGIEYTFLPESCLYDVQGRRWCGITKDEMCRDSLRTAVFDIVQHVLQDYASVQQRICRRVVDAHALQLKHDLTFDKSTPAQWSQPDVIITGTGSSFEFFKDCDTYTNVVTCIEVRADVEGWEEEDEIYQLGIYARQIFLQQPNRKFVRLLFMTESHVRFVHMDHAGCQYGEPIDYHKDPATLVQLIVGLSAAEDTRIGLDDTVKWMIKGGRKVGGFIQTIDDGGEPVWYSLLALKPIAMHTTIYCRGMVVWKARTLVDRYPVIIKDAHHFVGRGEIQEHDYLAMMEGIDGVAQMISYDLSLAPKTRIVMEAYGRELRHFISEEQFIGALRDSIAGHMNLYWKFDEYGDHVGILHRDVSAANILLTDETTPGNRGVLIDLDCAIIASELCGMESASPVGTRTFMSIAVLQQFFEDRRYTWHDHLDDLESFFNVTCYLMFISERPGAAKAQKPTFIIPWLNYDPRVAIEAKVAFFASDRLDLGHLSSFWSPASRTLLQEYFEFVKEIHQEKEELCQLDHVEARMQHENLHAEAPSHYAKVLEMFDKALVALSANVMVDMDELETATMQHSLKRRVDGGAEARALKKQRGGAQAQ